MTENTCATTPVAMALACKSIDSKPECAGCQRNSMDTGLLMKHIPEGSPCPMFLAKQTVH